MNLKQALKQKNQFVQEINELVQLIRNNNSIIVGNQRTYSPTKLMAELDAKTLELVALKAAIQKANVPVHEKIFMLSELKNRANNFRGIPTNEGKQRSSYGNSEPEVLEVELNQKQVRDIVKNIEESIAMIQDELDTFNAITEV